MLDPLSKRWLDQSGMVSADRGRGPVVLMYHSIEPSGQKPLSAWSVAARAFRNQMRLLQKTGWTTLMVRDLYELDSFPEKSVVLTFDDGFANNFEHGFRVLTGLGMKATWFVVTRDIGGNSSWPDPGMPVRPMLNEGQLREMLAAGMEVGAHSRSHRSLSDLAPQEIADEVQGSKENLETLLGEEVVSFAYPFGRFNQKCLEAVAAAGFKVACTTNPGWLGSGADLLQVRRVAVFAHDSLSCFARKLAFADTEVGWRKIAGYAAGRLASCLRRER